ncbi:hypothetical protein JGU71_28965 [Antrihabitans sp. YC3-6]|uniref:Uncharacterized protein n=1 Tax=Antrihabitans stalagmiti TaxID=2799499 RepID=A0A934NX82_9NOCA|nr:hypothetical protein [Antrihabitans stalagmiti]MBJ8342927.1 hypothetical protein [Antrihabitans stalagmiti]
MRPDRDQLGGIVEVNDSFVGGRTCGTAGGGTDKPTLVIAVEKITAINYAASGCNQSRIPTTNSCYRS